MVRAISQIHLIFAILAKNPGVSFSKPAFANSLSGLLNDAPDIPLIGSSSDYNNPARIVGLLSSYTFSPVIKYVSPSMVRVSHALLPFNKFFRDEYGSHSSDVVDEMSKRVWSESLA